MNTPINPAVPATAFSGTPCQPPVARPSGIRRVGRAFGALFCPAVLLAICIGCYQFLDEKEGSGNVVAQDRSIAEAFDGVELVGSPTVSVTVDEAADPKVVVTTDDNLLIEVLTEVKDGVLVINTLNNLSPTNGVRVDVTLPKLTSLRLTGSGDITAAGVKGPAFSAELVGSGDIQVSGTADAVNLSLNGSGDIRAEALEAQRARAKVTGSGDVSLTARQSADARINGSGDIKVAGKPPTITRSVTGSGDVSVQ